MMKQQLRWLFISMLLSSALAFQSFSAVPRTNTKSTLLASHPQDDITTDNNQQRPSSVTQRRSVLGSLAGTTAAVLSSSVFFSKPASAASSSPVVYGDADIIMAPKAHGTSAHAVQDTLRFGSDNKLADKICNFNRHFAERGGYFQSSTNWETVVLENGDNSPLTFYDSVTGKPLFKAPVGRSAEELIQESRVHGWPSFRDEEVIWDNVRVLKSSGETVSADGTHLGHNLPDKRGNRYCINVVSISGNPVA